ncbi:MAG: hypothetical protein DRN20_06265 [Thermoplasmata archaeon]|nr:MAG: hypothetical protein DRN20_06265 [Thermoplasmata archaeon]
MNRIKVINDPVELVVLLRATDTDVKREVLQELATDWKTMDDIVAKYGEEGKRALIFFEKAKLVETKWLTVEGQQPKKAYKTLYTSFHVNISCNIIEITDILAAAVMDEKKFKEIEKKIYDMAGESGIFAGDVEKSLNISSLMLRSLIKRSSMLEYKGHRIERVKEE